MELHCGVIVFKLPSKTNQPNKQTDSSFWLFCVDPSSFSPEKIGQRAK